MLITRFKKKFPGKKLSRIGTGGDILYYAMVPSLIFLRNVIKFSHDQKLPFYILGAGSNVLLSDERVNGIVLKLGGIFKAISFSNDLSHVSAGGGTSLIKLGNLLAEHGTLGYSYMAVIPGSVGGAIAMNAGTTNEGEIKDHFVTAQVFDPLTEKINEYGNGEMNFSNRSSSLLKTTNIVLQASFRLSPVEKRNKELAIQKIKELRSSRQAKQPKNPKTFGSTFKNPKGQKTAGWYLEKVGMKGMRIGGAMVAPEHANWIVNEGNATSNDVKSLIEIGKNRVYEEFGIRLQREVIFFPEDIEERV